MILPIHSEDTSVFWTTDWILHFLSKRPSHRFIIRLVRIQLDQCRLLFRIQKNPCEMFSSFSSKVHQNTGTIKSLKITYHDHPKVLLGLVEELSVFLSVKWFCWLCGTEGPAKVKRSVNYSGYFELAHNDHKIN